MANEDIEIERSVRHAMRYLKLNELEEEALKEMKEILRSKEDKKFEELREFLIDWLTSIQSLQSKGLSSLRRTDIGLGHSEFTAKWFEKAHEYQKKIADSLNMMHLELGDEGLGDRNETLLDHNTTIMLNADLLVEHCGDLLWNPPQP